MMCESHVVYSHGSIGASEQKVGKPLDFARAELYVISLDLDAPAARRQIKEQAGNPVCRFHLHAYVWYMCTNTCI